METPDRIDLRYSLFEQIFLLILTIPLGLSAAYASIAHRHNLGTLVTLALIAFVLLVIGGIAATRLCDRRPQVQIDETGIEDRRLGIGKIRWSDIASAHIQQLHLNRANSSFLVLKLNDAEKILARKTIGLRINSRLLGGELAIRLDNLDGSYTKIREIMKQFLAAQAAKAQ